MGRGLMNVVTRERIERLAQRFWEQRGRPSGSPEADWLRAERACKRTLPKLASGVGTVIGQVVALLKPNHLRGSRGFSR